MSNQHINRFGPKRAVTVNQARGGCGARSLLAAASFLTVIGLAASASAGCLRSGACAATISDEGKVGQTSYDTLPFASAVYAQSWGSSPTLAPGNLFWQSGSHFTNANTMAAAKQSAAGLAAKGIVPASGSQRWEDTYEVSQPASQFPGEPSWIAQDRQSLGLVNQPEFQAWVSWQKSHANLFMLGADGGQQSPEYRAWKGSWGHISPLMPIPAADWPAGTTNATYGDWYAYRWGQTAGKSGAYGIMLSDFSDSQPTWPSWTEGFNPEIIAGFGAAIGQAIPGSTIAQQANYITTQHMADWNDYLAQGYANFYHALAVRLSGATGQQALVIDQCGLWPSTRRFYGLDQQRIQSTMGRAHYICIWDDQTMQVGRSGQSMIWGIGGMVIAAAREPNIRNGGNLSADDAAFWNAAANFWPNLSAGDRQERGLKELKRAWLETAWSHVATRTGSTRRALAFLSRDYWDQGKIDPTLQTLIHRPSCRPGPSASPSTTRWRRNDRRRRPHRPAAG